MPHTTQVIFLGRSCLCISASRCGRGTHADGEYRNEAFLPAPPPLPHDLQSYATAYDEPYSDTASHFEPLPPDQQLQEAPSIERGNKLLCFHAPTYNFTLLDYSLRRVSLSLSAQLHGMFFIAESPRTAAADSSLPMTELTCYRRNLFQITGSIRLPRNMRYIVTDTGDRMSIIAQELSISASESVEGHPVKLISVPWKTPASGSISLPEEKTEKEPNSIPLDTVSNQDMDANYATFPVAWKRLQFRVATANNGRRKELQQHFIIKLSVVATLANGHKVSICDAISGAIIVRGRSPRNFQQRRDLPLSGSGNSSRKGMQPPSSLSRTSTNDSTTQKAHLSSESSAEVPQSTFTFEQKHEPQSSTEAIDWNNPITVTPPALSTPMIPSSSSQSASSPVYAHSSPDLAQSKSQLKHKRAPSATPVGLSLTDDETSTGSKSNPRPTKIARTRSTTSPVKKPPPRPSPLSAPPFTHTSLPSNTSGDSADHLYEYFPLGASDWMPPVDAVYRPHVVHHMNMPPVTTAGSGGKGPSKRYFSEDIS